MTKEQQQEGADLLKNQLLELAGRARAGSPLVGVEVRVFYSEDQDGPNVYRCFFWDADFTWSDDDAEGEELATDAAARMVELCDSEGLVSEDGAVDDEVITVSGSLDL